LIGVILGKVFRIKTAEIKDPPRLSKVVSVAGLMLELKRLTKGEELRFSESRAPPKQWLIKVIYSLDPNNLLFAKPELGEREMMSCAILPNAVWEKLQKMPLRMVRGSRTFPINARTREERRWKTLEAKKERELQAIEYTQGLLESRRKKLKIMEEREKELDEAQQNEKQKEDIELMNNLGL